MSLKKEQISNIFISDPEHVMVLKWLVFTVITFAQNVVFLEFEYPVMTFR